MDWDTNKRSFNIKFLLILLAFCFLWVSSPAQKSIGLAYQPNFEDGNGKYVQEFVNVNHYAGLNTSFQLVSQWSLRFELMYATENHDFSNEIHQLDGNALYYYESESILTSLNIEYTFDTTGKFNFYAFLGPVYNMSIERQLTGDFRIGNKSQNNFMPAYWGSRFGIGFSRKFHKWDLNIAPTFLSVQFLNYSERYRPDGFGSFGIHFSVNYQVSDSNSN